MPTSDDLDPVFASDRGQGSTPPETDEQSGNVVGRPHDAREHPAGVHEHAETSGLEREPFSRVEALEDGGSFDGQGVPLAADSDA